MEDVCCDVRVRVQLDDLAEPMAVRDAVVPLDGPEDRVGEIEEPVAVAKRLELPSPDRKLERD